MYAQRHRMNSKVLKQLNTIGLTVNAIRTLNEALQSLTEDISM